MRKKIGELLKEKFEYEPEKLLLSPERIEGTVRRDQHFRGKFSVSAATGKLTRGFVYSTNPRAVCTPEYFVGQRETFSYEADTTGLKPGETLEGAFVLCSVSGEYRLPYAIAVEEDAAKDGEQPFLSLEEFSELAREDFGKAYMLFASSRFQEQIRRWKTPAVPLYQGIIGQSVNYHSLEQFLVGLGQKIPLTISADNTHVYLNDPQENEREEILLTKNTWGFAAVHISCDMPFLTIERPEVTTEEFVGSTFSLGFVINREKLHAGRNLARIFIKTECRTLCCVVEARVPGKADEQENGRRCRQEILQLMNTYIVWRTGKTGASDLCGLSLVCLDNIKKAGGAHIFYELYRAYVMLMAGDQVNAQIPLEEAQTYREDIILPQWKAFYLYLTTIGNAEKEYVEYVKEEIAGLFLENQENWILQWLMLQINGERFRNDSEKLDAIRRQYICGCKSLVMYLEAWDIIQREPLMLRTLDDFEIHLLAFLCREKLVNQEICGQVAQLANRVPSYHPLLYRILCRCYELFPGKNMLTAICALLMKGHKNAPKYAGWFEKGVKQDVRLAGMYEYYAQTVHDLNIRELPQAVRMYFSYNNTLGYLKKAAIYANIIRSRDKDPVTFENYRPSMQRFMEEQLREGRINEDLALLYEALLTPFVLDERMADGLSRVLFTYEITCDNPDIHHVVAVHRQLRQEQRVQLVAGRACVQRYSDECCILMEGTDGVRYADPSLFCGRKLLTRPAFEDFCRGRERMPEGILLHDCCGALETLKITEQNEAQMVQFMSLPRIHTSFRRMAEEKLLCYYMEHPRAKRLEDYLHQAHLEELAQTHMGELTELLVSEGMCDTADRLIRQYGAEKVNAGTLVRLCSYQITALEAQEDAHLLALCARCLSLGTYDEAILQYLLRYYEGPIEDMKVLWRAGQQFSLEEFALEEKILAMILYMRQGMENSEPIFEAYLRKQGNTRLCRAYVIWMSYCYFVREMKVQKPVFTYIEQTVNGAADAPQACQLALLKYYAYADRLGAGQQEWRQRLLEKFTARGMYFRFYQRFPSALLRRFHLHDKYIFEYRCDPSAHVTMYYQKNDRKEQEIPMENVYEGIFVKQFTLFYQDKLKWQLGIESGHGTEKTSPQTIVCYKRSHRGNTGSYELINRMAEAVQKQDARQLKEIREQYVGQQYLAEQLFTLNR